MGNRKKVSPDPTVAEVAIEIGGERFRLCFDFTALAMAKEKMRHLGVNINILRALNFEEMDVDTVPALFFAVAQKYQPSLTWQRALELANLRTVGTIFEGIALAYQVAMVESSADPRVASSLN